MGIIYNKENLINVLEIIRQKAGDFFTAKTDDELVEVMSRLMVDRDYAAANSALPCILRDLSQTYQAAEIKMGEEILARTEVPSDDNVIDRSFLIVVAAVQEILPDYDISWYTPPKSSLVTSAISKIA